jgi:hypothetical protein
MIAKKNFEYRNNKAMVCWRPKSGNDYAIIHVPKVYRKTNKDAKDAKDANTELNQYKLIKDENNRIKININILNNPNNPITDNAVNFINQAISEYYNVEYYLDNIFNKAPILSKKTLDKFAKSERKIARKELVEEVDEEEGGEHVLGEQVVEKQPIVVEEEVDEIPDIVAVENIPNIKAISKKRGRPRKVIDPNEKPKVKTTRKQKIISLPVFLNEEV